MRVAVVTGASSGIGREFVRQLEYFYKDLDEIWVIARREERLEQLRKEVNVPLRIFAGDLQKKHVYRQFYTELCQWHPNIRMLVNAAGFGKSGTFSEIAEKGKRIHTDMIDLNCTALIRITQMTLPYMKMGSRIINMASAAAFCPQPSFAVYAASKACVLSFSRALGQELREKSIYVTAVCPGPVETEFFEVSGELKNPLKKLNMAAANKVVHRALIDSRKKKSVSVYGAGIKAAEIMTKLLIFFICQNKDMIQFLFDRSDAAWVFAPDHISDLFWKRELLFSDNLFVFYNIDGDIVIDKT